MKSFARLIQFLLERTKDEYWGKVVLEFRRGQIVVVRCEQTFDLQNDPKKLPVKDEAAVRVMETGKLPVAV